MSRKLYHVIDRCIWHISKKNYLSHPLWKNYFEEISFLYASHQHSWCFDGPIKHNFWFCWLSALQKLIWVFFVRGIWMQFRGIDLAMCENDYASPYCAINGWEDQKIKLRPPLGIQSHKMACVGTTIFLLVPSPHLMSPFVKNKKIFCVTPFMLSLENTSARKTTRPPELYWWDTISRAVLQEILRLPLTNL